MTAIANGDVEFLARVTMELARLLADRVETPEELKLVHDAERVAARVQIQLTESENHA